MSPAVSCSVRTAPSPAQKPSRDAWRPQEELRSLPARRAPGREAAKGLVEGPLSRAAADRHATRREGWGWRVPHKQR